MANRIAYFPKKIKKEKKKNQKGKCCIFTKRSPWPTIRVVVYNLFPNFSYNFIVDGTDFVVLLLLFISHFFGKHRAWSKY